MLSLTQPELLCACTGQLDVPLCVSLYKMTINKFFIEYDAINSRNTFTNGDTINGRIIVETSKEIKVQSLTFVAKGKAHVCWHEHYGQNDHRVYWADEKYYEVKHHILRGARRDGNVLYQYNHSHMMHCSKYNDYGIADSPGTV